ncbi:MAG TPA: asparagine synthetase B [Candidatus Krumholzibacteria bacterium]|jgi:hypothetical protein|nr:asparagine synthetase B [Candidatus Krumholzibacteria bacterium]
MRSSIRLVVFATLLTVCGARGALAQQVLVPMDLTQSNHLKAYGLAYFALTKGLQVEWLLNYKGGSFLIPDTQDIELEARLRNVTFQPVSGAEVAQIQAEIANNNMESVRLEKAPRMAIYVPPLKQPWDDAVMMALDYAQVPYSRVFDEDVLAGDLAKYDWLHLHHEDFTGQYGKFYGAYRNTDWYQADQRDAEARAKRLGFAKVSDEKKAVADAIRTYVSNGGFLFAMCSATDTFDIALAAQNVDVVPQEFDYDGITPGFQDKLDYDRCFAFTGFHLITSALVYEFSDIDTSDYASARGADSDYFTLFEFSAKFDPVPAMLTQNHVSYVKGFLGQTTGFKKSLVKKGCVVLGEDAVHNEVKYLHGNVGRGTFTFLGGHDPEDYQHAVGDPPTDLSLHVNSPGYRLILNNILFPAAKKKTLKT